MQKILAVVGAGPKSAAIAARAAILKGHKSRASVPDIIVFERDNAAAAWSGERGYSSGYPYLCTPGEKDVGFPYQENVARRGQKESIGSALFASFSWSAFLVATGAYTKWVDYGRDHPTHREWSNYIKWVLDNSGADIRCKSEVVAVARHNDRWLVTYRNSGALQTLLADQIVLTGSGKPRPLPSIGRLPKSRYFDAESFWAARDRIPTKGRLRVAVAGAGGAAGAIVAWLANRLAENEDAVIHSISPHGTLFPRGDGYSERRWFSDPSDWRELKDNDQRAAILQRTEAGVISARNKTVIDRSRNITFVRGRVERIGYVEEWPNRKTVHYWLNNGDRDGEPVDFFVNAIGFDIWSLMRLVDCPETVPLIKGKAKDRYRHAVISGLLPDFSIGDYGLDGAPAISMPKGLHFPALGDLEYGPGMSNLGSLGLMARHVLGQ